MLVVVVVGLLVVDSLRCGGGGICGGDGSGSGGSSVSVVVGVYCRQNMVLPSTFPYISSTPGPTATVPTVLYSCIVHALPE